MALPERVLFGGVRGTDAAALVSLARFRGSVEVAEPALLIRPLIKCWSS